ncbi:hypothetical protein [Sinorhizobium meliloti]|uniref:hypothetical protein n=1 Tax=Rhizobium meliloti TaxID=382 RepID=UPI000B49727F|nr:hypothetical protein [Sinorhizobium meliloti]ASP68317.1 hypothetical protein CDO29_28105 [Sinorhizobium meliloti]MCO6421769.1 hypothetical protein [Sinorhizobium meliloti]MDW9632121.1 hypothetical protein [Sinorhizobium meliloti]MDX0195495.1 hypothetical protein [Sinorhizobium meliloti]MDX0256856.1 hypothetical protein [Sinorhizobium meliloti]
MLERAHEAWLLQLSMQIKAIEQYVAALPGANAVDVSKVKASLESEYNGPHGDVVRAETVALWVDAASKRIQAIANGQDVPEFKSSHEQ